MKHTVRLFTACAGAAALTTGVFGAVGGTAHAVPAVGVPTLSGVVACDVATGQQVVTWTLTNETGDPIAIVGSEVQSSLTAGSTIDTSASLPSDLGSPASVSADTRATGDATGDYHLVVSYTFTGADPTVDGEVVLPGGCEVAPTTTTTTVAPTSSAAPTTLASSTTVAPAAQAVTAQPTYTG